MSNENSSIKNDHEIKNDVDDLNPNIKNNDDKSISINKDIKENESDNNEIKVNEDMEGNYGKIIF